MEAGQSLNAAAEAQHVNRQGGEGSIGALGERKYREHPCEAGVRLSSGKETTRFDDLPIVSQLA